MKKIIKTILFLSLAFIAAITGSWINHDIIQKKEVSLLLENAEMNFDLYRRSFDPAKKTIIVIGRSTAIYSFQDNKEQYDRYSFVDRLKENFNVLSLVGGNLFNFSQVHALLDYANSKIKNPDFFVIENPIYLMGDEFIDGGNDFILWTYCMGEVGSTKACQNFTPFYKQKENIGFSINPCSKKYQEELRISYLKNSNERKKVIKKIMECGNSFNSLKESESLVSESFGFGFAQDLSVVENVNPIPNAVNIKNVNSIPNVENVKNGDKNFRKYQRPGVITYAELLFINKYVEEILKDYHWKKIIFIPHHAKEVSKVKELPVFQTNKDRVYFLDFTNELRLGPKTFAENYPDGTHSHFWIQDLIADKIYEISNEKKMHSK